MNESDSCLHIRHKPSLTDKSTENIKLKRDAKIKSLISMKTEQLCSSEINPISPSTAGRLALAIL